MSKLGRLVSLCFVTLTLSVNVHEIARAESIDAVPVTAAEPSINYVPVTEECLCDCLAGDGTVLSANEQDIRDSSYEFLNIKDDDACLAKNKSSCLGYPDNGEQFPKRLKGVLAKCEMTTVVEVDRNIATPTTFTEQVRYDVVPNVIEDSTSIEQVRSDAVAKVIEDFAFTAAEADSPLLSSPENLEVETAIVNYMDEYNAQVTLVNAPVVEKCICYCANPATGSLKASTVTVNSFGYEYKAITTETTCNAKNKRRCAGWDTGGKNQIYSYGFLLGCEMTTVGDTKPTL